MADATLDAAAPTTPSTEGLWSPRHRILTFGLVLAITLVAFEALAVATIMPIVARDLGSIQLYGWVFSAFFLGTLLGIVVVGGLLDRGGIVRLFVGGLGLFSIGLVVGGLAPSMEVLIGARFIQGLGVGAIPPIAYVSIARALPEDLRPRMFATLSTAWVLPGVAGPAVSGAIAEAIHWRVVFLGLLPLIAIAAITVVPGLRRLPEPQRARVSPLAERIVPAVMVAGGAALVLAGFSESEPVVALLLLVVGAVLVIPGFGRLTPPGTLRVARGLPAAVLLRGVLTFMFFAADAYVPLALQDWRGLSASIAGIALTAATLSWTGGAWLQARWIARLGPRRFVMTGFLTVGLGVLAFAAVLSPAVPIVVGIVAWAIAGLGMGLSYSPLSIIVLSESEPSAQGAASAGLQLSDVLGTAFGAGIGGAIIAAGHRLGLEGWIGLAGTFALSIVAAAIGSLLASRLPDARVRAVTRRRAVGGASPEPTRGEP
jgi:MFS family permease